MPHCQLRGARRAVPSRFRSTNASLLASLSLLTVPIRALGANADITQVSLEELLGITVVGASKYEQRQDEVAASVSVLTREDIRTFGWRSVDEALASLPGVHTTYDRQYSYLGTRGFGLPGDFNTRLLVTINGNRLNDDVYDFVLSGQAFPLDLDAVERIEYIPGPGGAVYGQNALFGVVNFVTRSGAAVDGLEVAASYQDLDAEKQYHLTWGQRLDNGIDVLVSAAAFRAAGEDHHYDFGEAGVSGVARGLNGWNEEKFFVQAARGPWTAEFVHADNRRDDPTAQYFSDPLAPGVYQRDRQLFAQLQYDDALANGALQLTGRLFHGRERYFGRFVYEGLPFMATGSGNWSGVELRVLSTAVQGHKLMLGVEAQDNSRRDQGNHNLVAPDPVNDLEVPGSGWRAGIYVQDEWRLGKGVVATLGLRADDNDATKAQLSPRAALIWTARPGTIAKALYGRAHRGPNAYEQDYDDGLTQVANPDLAGETIDTLELVVDHRMAADLRLRVSAYRWQMRNLIVLGTDASTGLSEYQSGGRVKARGLEVSIDKRWSRGVRLRGSVSLQDTGMAGRRLANSPSILGRLNLSGPLGATGLRAGYELRYDGVRRTIDDSELKGAWLSNMNLALDASPWVTGLEISLAAHNLLDERYDHPGSDINWQRSIEQDGRSVRLMADWRFR